MTNGYELLARFGAAALSCAAPTLASAGGLGNSPPVVTGLSVSTTPAPAGATVQITCTGSDTDGQITKTTLSVSSGALSNGLGSIDIVTAPPQPTIAVVEPWQLPSTPGSPATITCTVWDSGPAFGGNPVASPPVTLDVPIIAATTPPPIIDSLSVADPELLIGASTLISATAHDPLGGALSFSWSASDGVITGEQDADPQLITWTAPALPGSYAITLTVTTTAAVQAARTVYAGATLARPTGTMVGLPSMPLTPNRVAVDGAGLIFVSDSRAGLVWVHTALGEVLRTLSVGGRPLGLAVTLAGTLLVGDGITGAVNRFDSDARLLGSLGVGPGELRNPIAIVVEPLLGTTYVVDGGSATVAIYDGAGTRTGAIVAGDAVLAGIALAGGEIFVSDAKHGRVLVYTPGGALVRTVGTFGGINPGEITRVSGIAVAADGNLYAVDSFQSRLSVFSAAGAFLTTLGGYGKGPGQLEIPIDVTIDPSQRLIVTNSENNRLEIFSLAGAPTVLTCAGDADCDGLPDAWELAHGFDPTTATDAWADPDADGLTNADEYLRGTDPRRADSDGDGVSDAHEIGLGLDPLDRADNVPSANTAAAIVTEPAWVVLDGSASDDPNGDPLLYAWTQVGGPESLLLAGAQSSTAGAAFRRAGVYQMQLRVSDGRAWSDPRDVEVQVVDVAPDADAGPPLGGVPGATLVIDGRFSSDANRDPITWAWRQSAGPPATLDPTDGPTLAWIPTQVGRYRFELSASDGDHESSTTVDVVVNSFADHVPTAQLTPVQHAVVGTTTLLDATGSSDGDRDPLTFEWTQVLGPPVALETTGAGTATFTPPVAQTYGFELVVRDAQHRSAPASSMVVATEPGNAAPIADAGTQLWTGAAQPVTLGCALSFDPDGEPVTCSWRQLEGTHVPLVQSGNDARWVPIEAGTYRFELEARDAAGAVARDEVAVIAGGPHGFPPVARIAAPAGPQWVGAPVVLDGAGSFDDDGDPLGYTWSQAAGAPAVVSDAHGETLTFTPPIAGHYRFELRVDDPWARGPAAQVDVVASPIGNQAPTARAGSDVLVIAGRDLRLDGTASSDPEGVDLAYRWQRIAGPARISLRGAHSDAPVLTPELSGFTSRLRLVVSDGVSDSAGDEVNVNTVDVPVGLWSIAPGEGGSAIVRASAERFAGLEIAVPAGAFTRATDLAVGAVTRPWYSERLRLPLGAALFIGPTGEALRAPLRVSLPLPEPSALGGIAAQEVRVSRYEPSLGRWQLIESSVDLDAKRISVQLTRLGVLQLSVPSHSGGRGAVGGGCSCSNGGREIDLSLLLLALVALIGWWRRGCHRAAWLGIVVLLAAGNAHATDAPHDRLWLSSGCPDCHQIHFALGDPLTAVAGGNANVCLSCHNSSGLAMALPLTGTDRADPVAESGTSHQWATNPTNPAFGALPPLDPQMSRRITQYATVVCSVCHDQHKATAPMGGVHLRRRPPTKSLHISGNGILAAGGAYTGAAGESYLIDIQTSGNQTTATFRWTKSSAAAGTWVAQGVSAGPSVPLDNGLTVSFGSGSYTATEQWKLYATWPFPRATLDTGANLTGNDFCRDCHRSWVNDHSATEIYQGGAYTSHPVGDLLNASAHAYDRTAPLDADGQVHGGTVATRDRDGNPSNDLKLDGGGRVQCLSCHGIHYMPGNAGESGVP